MIRGLGRITANAETIFPGAKAINFLYPAQEPAEKTFQSNLTDRRRMRSGDFNRNGGSGERELDFKGTALAEFAGDFDMALVLFDDAADQERPRPVPLLLVVKKGRNNLCDICCSDIPRPVSLTVTTAQSCANRF